MGHTKKTKEALKRAALINEIIDRAEELGIMVDTRLNHSMDIDYAVQVFDIDLKAWLDSTDDDFIHDYIGIYRNIDRNAISSKHFASRWDFYTFKPRFAKDDNDDNIDIFIKECLDLAREQLLSGVSEISHNSAEKLIRATSIINNMRLKYEYGKKVKYQGDNADDEILCPVCGELLVWNDTEEELRPKHCQECGTRLIY